jgi:hypothetical protein
VQEDCFIDVYLNTQKVGIDDSQLKNIQKGGGNETKF